MSAANSEVLAKALEEHSPAIISSGEGADRRDVLVQFTSLRTDASAMGFWARVHHGDPKVIDRLIKAGEEVGVSFSTSGAKISFRTALLKKRRRYLLHRVVLLRWPEKLSVVEQRHKPRVWVPDRFRLAAKIETLSPNGQVLDVAPVRVWDLGLEGASVICSNQFSLSLSNEATIRLTIQAPDSPKQHTYLATQRHLTRLSDQKLRLGVQFNPTADPSTAPAQRALKALINELDAVIGAHAMMGELRHKSLKPGTPIRM
jgi:c-di-GMP-binding flagellar brake protein YcgR